MLDGVSVNVFVAVKVMVGVYVAVAVAVGVFVTVPVKINGVPLMVGSARVPVAVRPGVYVSVTVGVSCDTLGTNASATKPIQ